MAKPSPNQLRAYLTLAVLFFETAHLAWESLHGGVVSHNLLNRRDLPAISNWWGLAFLPMLAWFTVGRVQSRDPFIGKAVVFRFLAALFYATCLATAFRWGYEATTSTLFFGMILLAVVIPLYKAEYILGFVLGMTLVFGAILPMLIASIIAVISLALNTLGLALFRAFRRRFSAGHSPR